MRVAGDNLKIARAGVTFSYDDYGPIYAPVVIFIHAFPFNKHMWDMQTEALKSNYRVISYDIRGFGGTRGPANESGLQDHCDDLIHLMELLHIRKAALCGLSLGGAIALKAIELFPVRFNALILSDTSCRYNPVAKFPGIVNGLKILREEGIRSFAEKSIRHFFTSVSFVRRKEEIRAARKMILSTPVSTICDTLKELAETHAQCTHLPGIHVPVLILVGSDDEITPPSEARDLQSRIPGSSLRIVRYAGHLPNLENSFEFNQHIRAFMDKVCSKRLMSEALIPHKV